MANSRSSKNSQPPAGCLFWLLLIIVVLILFVVNWGQIQKTLSETHFTEIVKDSRDSDKNKPAPVAPVTPAPQSDTDEPVVSPPVQKDSGGKQDSANPAVPPAAEPAPAAQPAAKPAVQPAAPVSSKDRKDQSSGSGTASPAGSSASGSEKQSGGASAHQSASGSGSAASNQSNDKEKRPVPAPAKMRSASLFFVRIEEDGSIVRQEVKRQIPGSDSPLSDSLAALLAGPNADEMRRGLVTLIPTGTKLISAQVRSGTVYLNFNEAFMYNHYGIEGYAGQLRQIVYTATAFPSVQNVQILIEGERHDYLGGEGVYIGKPLSRGSF